MHLGATIVWISCAKNYNDRFKLFWVIEENLADIFLRYMVLYSKAVSVYIGIFYFQVGPLAIC